MVRFCLIAAAALGFIGVMAGAYGAHGLEKHVAEKYLHTWEVAVRYQMYHALALLGVAWVCQKRGGMLMGMTVWMLAAGTALFSFPLYGYVLSSWGGGEPTLKFLAHVTPIGGIMQMAGWLLLIGVGIGHPREDKS